MTEQQIKKYSFPTEQRLSPDELRAAFWKCNYTEGSKPLHYWVILPNNVKPLVVEPVQADEVNLTIIGQYVRTDDSPYYEVQVVYEHVNYEMNASDWLLKKISLMGETILENRIVQGESTGKYLDVLTWKETSGGEEMISRFTVLKDYDVEKSGANLFCIKASCVAAAYEQLSLGMLQTVANFDLLNKSDWQMAESIFPFSYEFVEPLSFYIPDSWEVKYDEGNTTSYAHFIFLHNTVTHGNKGLISAWFYERDTAINLDIVLRRAAGIYAKHSHELPTLALQDCLNPAVEQSWNTQGEIRYDDADGSAFLTVCLVRTAKGWYHFEMMGPGPNFENDYWEINKRCMEMIIESLNNPEFHKSTVNHGTKPDAADLPEIDEKQKNSWLPPDWNY